VPTPNRLLVAEVTCARLATGVSASTPYVINNTFTERIIGCLAPARRDRFSRAGLRVVAECASASSGLTAAPIDRR
jgi:hypothetical protein